MDEQLIYAIKGANDEDLWKVLAIIAELLNIEIKKSNVAKNDNSRFLIMHEFFKLIEAELNMRLAQEEEF